jgi:HSP20 family protein
MRYRRILQTYSQIFFAEGALSLLGDPWCERRAVLAHPLWRPSADLTETPEDYRLWVEIAGVKSEDFDIILYDDAVVIEGERQLPSDGRFHQAEIRQGRFRLAVRLPGPVNPDQVEGVLERGLLTLRLPKVKSA